jgi:predicted transcriptional regulator of viral defense system
MNTLTEKVLENLKQDVFTDRDITMLFPGTSASRYGLMKRALKSGQIIRLRRGIYCLSEKYQRRGINLFTLSQQLYGPSFISLESALSYHRWIPEGVFFTTAVSMKKTISFTTPLGRFDYRHVPAMVFYEGVGRIEEQGEAFFMASPWKALCDYVYVYKKEWTSIDPLLKSLRIDEQDLRGGVQREELLSLKENTQSRRIHAFIDGAMKDLKL